MLNLKGALYNHFNYDKPNTVFEIVEQEMPEKPLPHQVLVRMLLAPVQPCDLWCARGTVNGVELPAYGGCEGLGVVEAIGDELEGKFTPGQRVHVCATPVYGHWETWQGTWRNYIMCPVEAVIPVPDGVSDEDASQFYVNPITCMAMVKTMKLGSGNVLLQTAAASVVGKIMIQLGQIYGFDTINIVRRQDSADELKNEVNAKYVYVYDGSPESSERVQAGIRDDMNDRHIDHCIESVGADTARLCLDLLGPNGHHYIYGFLSNDVMLSVNAIADIIMKNNVIHGWSTQEIWLRQTPEQEKQDCVNELWSLIADGRLRLPKFGEIYPLDKLHEAIAESVKAQHSGKVLLRLSED